DGALGAVRELTPEHRRSLAERGAIIVDDSDLNRLGIRGVGDSAEIHGRQVKVVGLTHGFRGPAGAHVFCSVETAQEGLRLDSRHVSYSLARCRDRAEARGVVTRLHAAYPRLSVFTAEELSQRSRLYWLMKTRAGIAMGYGAILCLLVGAIVTGQTLYGA